MEFLDRLSLKFPISDITQIGLIGVALYMRRDWRADGDRQTKRQTDRQTDEVADMTKVIGAFREYANAPNKIGGQ